MINRLFYLTIGIAVVTGVVSYFALEIPVVYQFPSGVFSALSVVISVIASSYINLKFISKQKKLLENKQKQLFIFNGISTILSTLLFVFLFYFKLTFIFNDYDNYNSNSDGSINYRVIKGLYYTEHAKQHMNKADVFHQDLENNPSVLVMNYGGLKEINLIWTSNSRNFSLLILLSVFAITIYFLNCLILLNIELIYHRANRINIHGDGNIVIQDLKGGTISINSNTSSSELKEFFNKLTNDYIDALKQISEQQTHEFSNKFVAALNEYIQENKITKGVPSKVKRKVNRGHSSYVVASKEDR